MRRYRTWLLAAATLVALAAGGALATAESGHQMGTPAAQHDMGAMMATPGNHGQMAMTGTGVVYLIVTNDGDEDDALVGASTDRAHLVEVHEMRVTDGVAVMAPHDGPLPIPAGETVALEPAGLHVMLIGLTDDIRAGDTFDLVLTFARAGEVTVPVTAVLDAEDAEGEPLEVGDLTIEGVWSRPAPMIDGAVASPAATPGT